MFGKCENSALVTRRTPDRSLISGNEGPVLASGEVEEGWLVYADGNLEMTHLNCFPEMGEIRVVGLKVKRKSTFYHLPESMLLGHVFQHPSENRFISIDLRLLNDLDGPALVNSEAIIVRDQMNSKSVARESSPEHKNSITNNGEDSARKKKKKKKAVRNTHLLENATDGSKKEYLGKIDERPVNEIEQFGFREPVHEFGQEKKWNSSSFVESPSETSSQAISVSGIIKRFFSNSDESVTSSQVLYQDIQSKPDDQLRRERDSCSNKQGTLSTHLTARKAKRTMPFKLTSTIRTPTDKLKTPQVGKRLVNASGSIGNEQNGASSLCQVKSRKMSELCSSVRGLVFEMSDSDD